SSTFPFGTYLTRFFVPTFLGNILAGISLVAASGHAQVVGGKSWPRHTAFPSAVQGLCPILARGPGAYGKSKDAPRHNCNS
ncbi:MAG TPA: hypothetical protein VF783_22705, partial [Terriglobales bacterium]